MSHHLPSSPVWMCLLSHLHYPWMETAGFPCRRLPSWCCPSCISVSFSFAIIFLLELKDFGSQNGFSFPSLLFKVSSILRASITLSWLFNWQLQPWVSLLRLSTYWMFCLGALPSLWMQHIWTEFINLFSNIILPSKLLLFLSLAPHSTRHRAFKLTHSST